MHSQFVSLDLKPTRQNLLNSFIFNSPDQKIWFNQELKNIIQAQAQVMCSLSFINF